MDKNSPDYLHKCSKCQILKPNSKFSPSSHKKAIRQYSSYCRTCHAEYGRTKDYSARSRNKRRDSDPIAVLFYNSKSNTRSSNKKLEGFNITREFLSDLLLRQNGKCYYTGVEMMMILGNDNSVSIDRKDPNLGYTTENVVLCTRKVNRMKSDATVEELIQFCKNILKTLNT